MMWQKSVRLIDERKDCQAWEFYYLYCKAENLLEKSYALDPLKLQRKCLLIKWKKIRS